MSTTISKKPTGAEINLAFDRTAALKYARKHWDQVSSDGYVGTNTGVFYEKIPLGNSFEQVVAGGILLEESIKRANGSLIKRSELEDCAHFISCCIGKPPGGGGGGLSLDRPFPTGPYGILNANGLYNDLLAKNLIEVVSEQKTYADTRPQLTQIGEGDLIFYWYIPESRYGHAGLYLANADRDIACHTYCRCDQNNDYPQSWDSVGDGSFPMDMHAGPRSLSKR